MPPVKGRKPSGGGKKAPPPAPTPQDQQKRAASLLTGIAIIAAATVGVAAWLGGEIGGIRVAMDRQVQSTMTDLGLAVEDVFVAGVDGELARKVRAAAMVEPGESMLAADPHRIREQVLALDFVREARVYRYWPDQVFIAVSLRTPVAVLETPAGASVIDDGGVLMRSARLDRAETLPRVAGEGAGKAAWPLVAALDAHPAVKGRMARAERIGDRRWDIHLIGGAVLTLPEDKSLKSGLAAASSLAKAGELLDANGLRLDLRQPNALFTRPLDPSPLDGSAAASGA